MGEVFAVEKVLRKDKKESLFRHNENYRFIKNFYRPKNWNEIVDACVQAAVSVGLDIGACDVMYNKDSFKICEINSGPGMGRETIKHYERAVGKIIEIKSLRSG